jgi:PKD repeat protein
MKPTYSRLSILFALIIGLLLVGSVCAAEQENETLEITPDVTLQVTPEITTDVTPEITAEITTEITPDLMVTELFAADDLPALEAAGDPLVANFTQNRTYGPAPLPIQFYDRSTGTPTNWSWDFGDGATSDLKNSLHTYASAGTYTVTLVVSDGVSSDTYEVTDRIRADTPVAPVAALSANKTSWSSPAAVQFYDRSTGYPTSWAWDFGDGAIATVKNPVHTYVATGNYTITLMVTNDLGTDTKVQTEYFHAYDPVAPTAALSANKTSWSSPSAVQFYDRSAGFPTSWQWDFGDGSTANVKNPVHTYTTTGNYTVTLSVTNDLGSDTITQTEYFHAYDPVAPTAALSANKTSWSSPSAVQFYDRSTGFPTSWSWDFGDGATATVKNPVHTYETTGNYTVTLSVTNDLGSDTITQTEYFHAYDPVAPTAALSANKTSWSSPAAVQFYDRSAGFPTSWSWDFGDGATATVKNPVHTYMATGNYTVTLVVTNDLGTDTKVQTDYFHAYDSVAPVAAISANKTSWSAPAAIQFYDRSTGFPTAWAWDFGDGETSNVKNPVHTFDATGNYTVILTATNDLGSDTKTAIDYIIVSGSSAPVAALSANKTSWSSPAAIQFYDRSAGFPTSWAWDFGDGATSTLKNPVHTYTGIGNYTVNLTVTNEVGSDTKVAADYIRVSGSAAPVAAISANKTSWSSPAAIQFYDRSAGFPTSWAWDFGDGTTANVKNPVHTYTGIGNYTVNLTVTNEVGSDTKVMPDYIRVSAPVIPVAKLSANRTAGPAPIVIQFYDRSTGFPTEWLWDFGDGTNSTLKNPVHAYSYGGNYTISLTAANVLGNTSVTALNYIKASGTGPSEPVVASFTADLTEGMVPLAVNFTDHSTGSPVSWNWSFGDGSFSEEQHPEHSYLLNGTYTVSLVVRNSTGFDMMIRTGYISVREGSSGPVARFTAANATVGQAPFAIAFTDLSEGAPVSWNWSFGDGSFSEAQNPVHTYTGAGSYMVSLTASDAFTSHTRTIPEYVFVQPALPAYDARMEFSSVSPKMFQSEPYLVDIHVINTGSRTWSGDPANPDYVYLEGLGGSSGDAAKFNLTHIPMLFENETVAPDESYDFYFFMQTPDIIGNYSPAFQMNSAGNGHFGEISNGSVEVIENPFHPVTFPNGTKLYTTTFGNLSSGMSVSIVGPKVYLDKLQASGYQDPRFLINPTLKSEVFDFKLNDTFNYADITVKYDPVKVSDPANLSISYFNTTTGNFTFVPSTVDIVNHTVTARVTHFSIYEILDQIKYMALPFLAQNDMGWMDMDTYDTWTINPPVDSFDHTSFAGGADFPPGAYTILTSGSYSNTNLMGWGCYAGWATADSNQDSWSGMYIVNNNPSGIAERQVQAVRSSSGVLTIIHNGGPISMYNRHSVSGSCGSVSYQMHYSAGPVIRDPNLDYDKQLLNDALILKNAGFDGAYNAYMRGLGCLVASTGHTSMEHLQSLVHYALFLGNSLDDISVFVSGYTTCEAVTNPTSPVADFSSDVRTGTDRLTVTFTDTSANLPTFWYWTFGDGTNSNDQNPKHEYNSAGTYTVTLTVKNKAGSNTITKTRYVIVTPAGFGGYNQCSDMPDFEAYQNCVSLHDAAYCDGLCGANPDCDITGPSVPFTIDWFASSKTYGQWRPVDCGPNALLNFAKEGDIAKYPSKNILSTWGWRATDKCPSAGHSYAFNNPGGKDVYLARILNNDKTVIDSQGRAAAFYHEVAAELRPNQDAQYLTSWRFFNYGNSDIQPGDSQMPTGTKICYTTVAIKKVTGLYGDGEYYYKYDRVFRINENNQPVSAQPNTCTEQDNAQRLTDKPCKDTELC